MVKAMTEVVAEMVTDSEVEMLAGVVPGEIRKVAVGVIAVVLVVDGVKVMSDVVEKK